MSSSNFVLWLLFREGFGGKRQDYKKEKLCYNKKYQYCLVSCENELDYAIHRESV